MHRQARSRLSTNQSQSCWWGYVAPWAFGLVIVGAVSISYPAFAQSSAGETPIAFSIPAQPLAAALDRYGDATGREAFYEAGLTQGRASSPVDGTLKPREALDRLLAGTGLVVRHMPDNSFVLLPNSLAERQSAAPSPAERQYFAVIQLGLREAFCESDIAHPGRYRFVALFWIGATGAVLRAQRLGSAGTPELDRRIDATLRTIKLNEAPPPGFEQPALIMVVPQAPGVTMGCDDPRAGSQLSRNAR
jgi:hypothetical protein